MPRTRSLAWAELKVGLLAITALALAAVMTFLVGGQTGFFWQRYHLKTRFADVRGLKPGAVVRVAGVEVGKVASMAFAGAEVEVVLEIRRDVRSRITERSRASIGALSVLGEPVVEITPAAEGRPLGDWAFLPAARGASQLNDVATSATTSLDEATRLLRDVRAGRGTVGRLFTDDTLYRDIAGFVAAAEDVAGQLARGRGTLAQLVRDPQAYRALVASLQRLEEVTRRLESGEGTLGRLLADDELARSFAATGRHLDAVTGRIADGQGTLGRLVTEPELYDRLTGLATRIERVSARLEAGDGVLGQLLQDKRLYENMNEAVGELRALVTDIRKDPRKFLTVRVSLF